MYRCPAVFSPDHLVPVNKEKFRRRLYQRLWNSNCLYHFFRTYKRLWAGGQDLESPGGLEDDQMSLLSSLRSATVPNQHHGKLPPVCPLSKAGTSKDTGFEQCFSRKRYIRNLSSTCKVSNGLHFVP